MRKARGLRRSAGDEDASGLRDQGITGANAVARLHVTNLIAAIGAHDWQVQRGAGCICQRVRMGGDLLPTLSLRNLAQGFRELLFRSDQPEISLQLDRVFPELLHAFLKGFADCRQAFGNVADGFLFRRCPRPGSSGVPWQCSGRGAETLSASRIRPKMFSRSLIFSSATIL